MFKATGKKMMLLMLAACMVMLTACGGGKDNAGESPASSSGSENQPVKLKFYAQYSGENIPVYDAAKEAMKKVMPEVEVEFEVAAQDDEQKIKTYAAAGTLPDIFFASSGLIEVFRTSDNLMQLDQIVKDNNIEEMLNPTSKAMLWNKDGHSYAVPNVGQWAAIVYYNKELFESNNVKVPENYTEFLAAVKTFSSKDITPLALFAKEKWPIVQLYDMAVVSSEPGGLKKLDGGEGTFSDEAYIKGANKVAELSEAGILSKNAFNMTWDDAMAQFTSGKSAMILNGAWVMNDIYKAMGDKVDILYTPLVDAETAETTKWNISGGGFNQGFAVSKNSKNPEVAAKYAALFSIEFAKSRVELLGDPNPILNENPEPKNGLSPIQQKYAADSANFKTMTSFAWGLENAKFKTAIEDNTPLLLLNKKVDAFIEQMNKSLEAARK
ncbi:ABC transporter substrate-binding protein [Paenibacillus dakarensis]|uniref:ABC transporter substrate-binding protein n=1 Tax=Paenibacillus dakarensis TaxID=1527293 RepID=UPI0006D53E6B|nr:extracellular solute-binding protein [Paenibacillus dakarensis]